jgi:hypothetical protein
MYQKPKRPGRIFIAEEVKRNFILAPSWYSFVKEVIAWR